MHIVGVFVVSLQCVILLPFNREWVEVIRRVRTMPEQKVKSMLVQEVDPRKALLTLDLELIESVTATDQEKRSDYTLYNSIWTTCMSTTTYM